MSHTHTHTCTHTHTLCIPCWHFPSLVVRVVNLHMKSFICFHGNIRHQGWDVRPVQCLITGVKGQLWAEETEKHARTKIASTLQTFFQWFDQFCHYCSIQHMLASPPLLIPSTYSSSSPLLPSPPFPPPTAHSPVPQAQCSSLLSPCMWGSWQLDRSTKGCVPGGTSSIPLPHTAVQ